MEYDKLVVVHGTKGKYSRLKISRNQILPRPYNQQPTFSDIVSDCEFLHSYIALFHHQQDDICLHALSRDFLLIKISTKTI